jgi:hypothetical protein
MMEVNENYELYTTSVSDYHRNMVNQSTGQKYFDCVYPSIMGKREFVISTDNCGDTESLLEVIKGELARTMNRLSIKLEFKNPLEVLQQSKMDKWEAFERVNEIVSQLSKNKHNKRTRVTQEADNYYHTPQIVNIEPTPMDCKENQKFLYSQAVVNNPTIMSPIITCTRFDSTIDNTVNTNVNQLEETVEELKTQLKQLAIDTNVKIDKATETPKMI